MLSIAGHRPLIRQTWHDALFAHWSLPARAPRTLVPAPLATDTYKGEAWVGIVPFRMSGVRLPATPALPRISAFPELKVRTCVTATDKPGA